MKHFRISLFPLICILMLTFLSSCKEILLHGLSEVEASRLISHLSGNGIQSEKSKQTDGKWSLSVEKADSLKALKYLQSMKLLGTSEKNLPEKSSVISSKEDQRFNYERALSREIETTLANIEGVLIARVHLNLPQVDPVFNQRLRNDKGSGSVLIIATKDLSHKPEEIALLVGGASGIDAANVSILLSNSGAEGIPIQDEGGIRLNAPIVAFHENVPFAAYFQGQGGYFLCTGALFIICGLLILVRVRLLSKKEVVDG